MTIFKYKAIDATGMKVCGHVTAPDYAGARRLISNQFDEIISIHATLLKNFFNTSNTLYLHVSIWLRFLGKFLSNGLPIDQALLLISDCAIELEYKVMSRHVAQLIRQGFTLTKAMKLYENLFPACAIALLGVAEKADALQAMCINLSHYYSNMHNMRNKIFASLRYPIMTLLILCCVFYILLHYLVPQIAPMLEEIYGYMPLPMKIMQKCALLFSIYGLLIGLIIGTGCIAFGKHLRINIAYYIPWLWRYKLYKNLAFFFLSISMALKSGMKLVESMQLATTFLEDEQYRHKIDAIYLKICNGCEVGAAFSAEFACVNLQLLSFYEKSQQLAEGFEVNGKLYEEKMFELLEQLQTWIQPLALIILTMLLLAMGYAIFFPMYDALTMLHF